MKLIMRASIGFLPLLFVFLPMPAAGQSIALQIQLCHDDTKDALSRIDACSAVIASGRVIHAEPFLMQRGRLYIDQGMHEQGNDDFTAAKDFSGNSFDIPYLNAVRLCNNEMEEASARFEGFNLAIERATERDLAPLLMRRGELYLAEEMPAQAIEDMEEVLNHRPVTGSSHYRAARSLAGIGEYTLANGHFDAAIRLNPRNAIYYNSKAWMLATAPDDAARNGDEAVAAATRAVQLEDEADFRDTLAAALAEAGDFARAIEEQEIAIEMYDDEPFNTYVREATERLELYRNGLPYRTE